MAVPRDSQEACAEAQRHCRVRVTDPCRSVALAWTYGEQGRLKQKWPGKADWNGGEERRMPKVCHIGEHKLLTPGTPGVLAGDGYRSD
jgi:hypothetical protein